MGTPEFKLLYTAYAPDQFPQPREREIVLVGRSNVGKSSLLNRLAGLTARDARKVSARISSQPGCTRSINFYQFWENVLLVDLPGFGYAHMSLAQRRALGQLVDAYLDKRPSIACVLHVVDARLPLQAIDKKMLAWGKHFGYFHLLALNKCDKLSRIELEKQKKKFRGDILEAADRETPMIAVSAKTGLGLADLARALRAAMASPQLQ
ncbi:MAG: ribosome biogenesis GTP-binding protein YsxC [Candidatus Firestonebacteria bacterium]|nr:ribosome biogenesis GTP-binding protein YsxC [Candidatus Firestonebacteria bacterium]